MKIRAFFALTLSGSIIRKLANHADTLCQYDRKAEVNWSDSNSYHVTLCFMGDIKFNQVDLLEYHIKNKLTKFNAFELHIDKAEYYQVSHKLALIAALPSVQPQLQQLRQLITETLDELGINYRGKSFTPHVTLGRLSGENQFPQLESWPKIRFHCLINSVVLLQSTAGENGSIYSPLFEIPLQELDNPTITNPIE